METLGRELDICEFGVQGKKEPIITWKAQKAVRMDETWKEKRVVREEARSQN